MLHRVTAALTQEQLPGGKLLFRVRADQAGKVAQWLKRLVVKSNLMARVSFPGTTFLKERNNSHSLSSSLHTDSLASVPHPRYKQIHREKSSGL